MRLVIARCSVDYTGRLTAHLPLATRLLVHKGDGSLLVHSDGGSYKPLNWMSPPCTLTVHEPDAETAAAGVIELWRVTHAKTGDALLVRIYEVLHDSAHELGVDPGLVKDGVEADLQRLLAEQVDVIGDDLALVRREFPTAIGPVDLLLRAIPPRRDDRGRIRGPRRRPPSGTSPSRSSAARASTPSSSSRATSSCSTAIRTSLPSAVCSRPRASPRRPRPSPATAASTRSCSTTTP